MFNCAASFLRILTDTCLDSLPFACSMDPSRRRRMFRDLDNYTPPTPRQSERHSSLNEPRLGRRINEDLMEEALSESRREYEADRQMMAGWWSGGRACRLVVGVCGLQVVDQGAGLAGW